MKVNNKSLIIEILKKNDNPISGEELSRNLGISRTAIWKNIKKLSDEGYSINSSHSGYILNKEEDLLLPYEFIKDSDLYIYKENTGSTMDNAKELIFKERAKTGSVIVAGSQITGRGKGSDSFISPKGGLYFTTVLFPDCPLSYINLYPMATLIAVKQSLLEICGLEVTTKWPFESWLNNNKISGILHEYSVKGNRCEWLTIGIGINPGFSILRRDLLISIKNRLFKLLENKDKILGLYKDSLDIIDKTLTFNIEGKEINGKVLDIDKLGTLLLKSDSCLSYGYIGDSAQKEEI